MERVREQVFGRERLLREVTEGVLAPQPQSFSLVGSRQMGKSRLLQLLVSETGPLRGDNYSHWRPLPFRDGRRVIPLLLDCDHQDARQDLMQYIESAFVNLLRNEEQMALDWAIVDEQSGPIRRLWQIMRQLSDHRYRPVLLLDNFDSVFEQQILSLESIDELRPLTLQLALITATEQPLHDIDRDLAASPLFNVMTQLFINLIEPEAARQWLNAYVKRYPGMEEGVDELQEITGGHPFLLRRTGDILYEVDQMLPSRTLGSQDMSQVRLRLAEYARPLFVRLWRRLQAPPRRVHVPTLLDLIEYLIGGSIASEAITREQRPVLNWLQNNALVTYTDRGYRLFSPLFGEFLAGRVTLREMQAAPLEPKTNSFAPALEPSLYEHLTKIEGALLRYFAEHAGEVISSQMLLEAIWKRPNASNRRVQEAIRRLRMQLEAIEPPIGMIENERGQGYRFVPAQERS